MLPFRGAEMPEVLGELHSLRLPFRSKHSNEKEVGSARGYPAPLLQRARLPGVGQRAAQVWLAQNKVAQNSSSWTCSAEGALPSSQESGGNEIINAFCFLYTEPSSGPRIYCEENSKNV